MKNKSVIFFFGTKAQFIKTKPVLSNLNSLGVDIKIIDTCQHVETTKLQLQNLKFQFEYKSLSNNKSDISTLLQMLKWFISLVIKILFSKREKMQHQICLIHGDTASTLLGVIWAKINKVKIVHIESGWRSNNLFKPFPEELIRHISEKFANVLIPDGKKQFDNIKKYENKKTIIPIDLNTNYDSLLQNLKTSDIQSKNLIVAIHRTENIYNSKSLNQLMELLIHVQKDSIFSSIDWYCHQPTLKILKKKNYYEKLISSGIKMFNLIEYSEFVQKIYNSKAVLTDGGGVAKETALLNIPLVIWRQKIGTDHQYENLFNVLISNYNNEKIMKFFNEIDDNLLRTLPKHDSPSQKISKELFNFMKL